ncbi:unnamed protein product [Schistocephalus solidus]|uniref:Uncharacterized protein n=1 Tax=Schistocephalus solidus TaxID=70667 RepID=A0A183TDN1_SCHSO|nr:unnamed protein product [Schistocephalus solidus]
MRLLRPDPEILFAMRAGIGPTLQCHPFSGLFSLAVPAILREVSEGTSYRMVRLVFRPILTFDDRFVRPSRCGYPPEFPVASTSASILHHLSGLIVHAPAPPDDAPAPTTTAERFTSFRLR